MTPGFRRPSPDRGAKPRFGSCGQRAPHRKTQRRPTRRAPRARPEIRRSGPPCVAERKTSQHAAEQRSATATRQNKPRTRAHTNVADPTRRTEQTWGPWYGCELRPWGRVCAPPLPRDARRGMRGGRDATSTADRRQTKGEPGRAGASRARSRRCCHASWTWKRRPRSGDAKPPLRWNPCSTTLSLAVACLLFPGGHPLKK